MGRGAPEFDILEVNTCPTTSTAPGGDLMRCPNDTATSGPFKAGPRLFNTMHFTPKNPVDKVTRNATTCILRADLCSQPHH